ncbi:OmpA family protein [Pseudocnuella soli]|uniref:OmpA family protein n=1 Tax=Pseudocnuella soli TaxID=2502779 RepID=UPI00104BDBE2|nr:OmpA family protein [Pseudocnuella soli]
MKNRCTLFLFAAVFLFQAAQAQYNPDKVAKKAVAAYNEAMQQAENGAFPRAIKLLEDAVQKDAGYVEAWLSLGGVYGQMKQHEQSVAAYEKAFALDSNYTSDFRLPYAINLAGMGQFDKALQVTNALLGRPGIGANTRKAAEYRRKSYQFAVEFAQSDAAKNYVFKPENLGSSINSPASEYWPSMSVEGNQMIFTRRDGDEDFYISEKSGAGWQPAFRLNGSINTPNNEGAQIISQDGQWLVFAGKDRPGGYGGFDIYVAYKTPQGWSEAINLGSKINTDSWESQPCLSPDKRAIYFASSRPGGYGGSDIYVSYLQPNGRFGEPQNMGPGINTAGEDACPFMHADGQTLYFSSNGWPGYGEGDIFVVRRTDTGWTQPQNLGYPINTINNEATLFVEADGQTAYYSSDRSDSRGGLDIYRFELRPDVRPAKTLWVKGKVFDQKTTAGLPSAVELIDLATNKSFSRVQTDEAGNYLITLPLGKDYAFNVARKGYLFYSDNFSLKQKPADSTYQKDIPLQPIELNASVVLRNIFFDVAKYNLKPESQAELDRVVALLQENPSLKIQIEGHTDNVGSAADNATLSLNRAKAVTTYLSGKGIEAARLQAKGFGATVPVADNNTDAGRAQNRRTELKIVGK